MFYFIFENFLVFEIKISVSLLTLGILSVDVLYRLNEYWYYDTNCDMQLNYILICRI